MTFNSILQIAVYFIVFILLVKPLGLYMAHVYQGEHTFLDRPLRPVERFLYRLFGIKPEDEMDWKVYAISLLVFSLVSFIVVYLLQRIQGFLPFNPQKFGAVNPDLSFNTAISFITNTNWQAYGGESTLSNFSQMGGITFPMFTSATTGFVVAMAWIRAFTAQNGGSDLGNFYRDFIRFLTRVLLPICRGVLHDRARSRPDFGRERDSAYAAGR